LIAELRTGSERFEELWCAGRSGHLRTVQKTVEDPALGPLPLDCDTLLVPDGDQTLVVYSAAPGTRGASGLELLRVTGTERFAKRTPPPTSYRHRIRGSQHVTLLVITVAHHKPSAVMVDLIKELFHMTLRLRPATPRPTSAERTPA
jgi:hypothetical protein